MESPEVQRKIKELPNYSSIRFNNLSLTDGKVDTLNLQTSAPYLIFDSIEAPEIAEKTGIKDAYLFKFRLNEQNELNKDEADEWFDRLLNFYHKR